MKLSGLVPMQALGMASRSHKLVKEAEEMCPKCGKPGTDKQSWKACDKGIHSCVFIFIEVLDRFFDLV